MTGKRGGHLRAYRSLLRFYPADYRARFGDEMVQLFADQLRDDGPGRSWLRAMGDVPSSAVTEYLRRNRTVAHSVSVAPTPVGRVLGALGVLGGAFLLLAYVPVLLPGIAISSDVFNLRLVLFNVGAIAIAIGVYMRHAAVSRRLALAGSAPAVIANALYVGFVLMLVSQPGELGPGDYQPIGLFILASLAMWLSDAWLGLVAVRLGVLNRLSAVALIIGSILAMLGMSNFGLQQPGSLAEVVIQGGIVLHGLAWIALGLEVALRRRAANLTS